jgi:hypothetical protein
LLTCRVSGQNFRHWIHPCPLVPPRQGAGQLLESIARTRRALGDCVPHASVSEDLCSSYSEWSQQAAKQPSAHSLMQQLANAGSVVDEEESRQALHNKMARFTSARFSEGHSSSFVPVPDGVGAFGATLSGVGAYSTHGAIPLGKARALTATLTAVRRVASGVSMISALLSPWPDRQGLGKRGALRGIGGAAAAMSPPGRGGAANWPAQPGKPSQRSGRPAWPTEIWYFGMPDTFLVRPDGPKSWTL